MATKIKYETLSVSAANKELVRQVAKDYSETIGIPVSLNDAVSTMASAYFELKKSKQAQKESK